ncbi:MAG: hemerythrin family protein [Gammaproteobacteria bacterium]|nr:hemerythrin family protein [Gammaproteobacteria bacterium]
MSEKRKLVWKEDEYSVGNAEMDEQHKLIFTIINELFANESSKSKMEVLTELIDYSNVHFSSEEDMLNDTSYAERFDHALLHDEYNKRLVYFLDHIDDIDIEEIYDYARLWWSSHVLVEDMKYKNN